MSIKEALKQIKMDKEIPTATKYRKEWNEAGEKAIRH